MGHGLLGRGRASQLAIIALALAAGLPMRGANPQSALAAGVDAASPPSGAAAVNPGAANPAANAPILPAAGDQITSSDGTAIDGTTIDDTDGAELPALERKFESVSRRVAPAVVSISAAETASDIDATFRSAEMNPQLLQSLLEKTTRTIGTGFIVEPDGFIVTNEHVIEDSQQFWVTTDDQKVYPAIVVGSDPRGDLAVLKIPSTHLPTVKFAPAPVQRGQWALTMGNPYGLATEGKMSLSVGVVSATGRSLSRLASKEDRLYSNLIQTTAQINPGNSGGPLLDLQGRVIGIDCAVILPQKQTNGIGFAIPITPELLAEIKDLKQGRERVYGYLGVTIASPTPLQCQQAGFTTPLGVCVQAVEPNSPATADIEPMDLIVQVGDGLVTDTDRFVRLIGAAPVGQPVTIGIVRDGKRLTVNLTPVQRPVQLAISNRNQRMYWRGMELGPRPTNWPAAGSNKHRAGVLVMGIQDDSPLKKQGVCAGMVITAIAGRPVATILEVQRVLNDIPPEQCTVETAADTTEVAASAKK